MRISGQPFVRPTSLAPPQRPISPFETKSAGQSQGSPFANLLVDQVKNVNEMQTGAETMMQSLLTGGDVNEAEVLTAVQKADLAFRMLLQMRNKLMEAYREIQQIQI